MRKLASIQKIKKTEPIENADAIEKVFVLGWQLVAKKNEYKEGDLCVYMEIDSLLPDRPEFEFLKARKMRIQTIKLRGQISQGICFPLSILPIGIYVAEGEDVTEILGVEKYDPPMPACLAGEAKGRFPSFIPKTDETRVQVIQELLDEYKGQQFYISEKLDGSSVTYFIYDDKFGVCSRNLELIESEENSYWQVARDQDIEKKLRSLNGNYAIQGELVGEGIQKNTLNIRGQDVYFFNLFNIDKHKYADFKKFTKTIKKIKLKTVPIITNDYKLENDIDKLSEMSVERSVINPKAWREGIVFRLLKENEETRVSFKAVNPKFLLKYDG